MTDEQKAKTKIRVLNFAKLAAALATLATAITGYVEVRKNQNNLLEVMSDKVDAIVLKVAYLEGRVDGLTPKEAAKKAEERVQPEPPKPEPSAHPEVVKVDNKLYRPMPRNFSAIQMVIEQKINDLDKAPEMAAPPDTKAVEPPP